MMTDDSFSSNFKALTGNSPFPWQIHLYKRFSADGAGRIPEIANLPTGLGKTSIVAIWLIALAEQMRDNRVTLPRRLVYVVNRRTVVDQTTREAERLKSAVEDRRLPGVDQLAISTLRGQYADNAEWSADPSRPAVICGTVDMIGSRLLFNGYRIGFKSRPLHAGFLGQDALLVHDEAHLEPAFQKLVETIQDEQRIERERNGDLTWPGLRVMALSATARNTSEQSETSEQEPFTLTDEEKNPPAVIPDPPNEPDEEPPVHKVWRRLKAEKSLHLHSCDDASKVAKQIAGLAKNHKDTGAAVLIFAHTVKAISDIVKELTTAKKGEQAIADAENVQTLTGTMRGYERDQLVRNDSVFARFMPASDRPKDVTPAGGTVYLVCTSAGEVGVNLSADHMVCDLSTFDSMAQRLGRVNRFGVRNDTRVDVVHPDADAFDDKHSLTPARRATLDLLKRLEGDASPKALGDLLDTLSDEGRDSAFAPTPTIPRATDILFDTWAMTTIRGKMPGRPPVAPYLHGVAEWEPPHTSVAWRDEVGVITDELIEREGEELPQELLADYPLKPHELLSDRADQVYEVLQKLIAKPKKGVKGEKRQAALARADRNAKERIWLIDDSGSVTVTTLGTLLEDDKKRAISRLEARIVLLPPSVGGLSAGMLNADSAHADDVADQWLDDNDERRRGRVWDEEPPPTYSDNGEGRLMALIRTIDTDPLAEEAAPQDEEGEGSPSRNRFWHWYAQPRDAEDATRASARPIAWDHHTRDVVTKVKQIVGDLKLPGELKRAVTLAAELHDLGKKREIWQRAIGNPNPTEWYAKPGKPDGKLRWRQRRLSYYRHEFGSMLDVVHMNGEHAGRIAELSDETRDVVLHLVAAHHGYARPHFPPEVYDHERYNTQQNQDAAHQAMRRYARLQRRYGRWGLAYLESLLRAADWDASANPSESDGDA